MKIRKVGFFFFLAHRGHYFFLFSSLISYSG
jgi:hypothetical protein